MTSLSRVSSTPLGKLTASVPTFKIDEDTFDMANQEARKAGMTLSEWVRTLVMVRVHGVDSVSRMYEDRLRVIAGMECLHDGGSNV